MLATVEDIIDHPYQKNNNNKTFLKKRKTTIPQRAIPNQSTTNPDDKYVQGIVNLDVYSIYAKNPELLLKNSAFTSSVSTVSSGNNTPTISSPNVNNNNNLLNSTAPSPLISSGVIDMSQFKNTQGAPSVIWKKGGMLMISPSENDYDHLTPEELKIASVLRVLPTQYLHIKETILTQVHLRGPFKKRDAKSWFRIDVNKIAILFDWFRALGWIPSDEEWESKN